MCIRKLLDIFLSFINVYLCGEGIPLLFVPSETCTEANLNMMLADHAEAQHEPCRRCCWMMNYASSAGPLWKQLSYSLCKYAKWNEIVCAHQSLPAQMMSICMSHAKRLQTLISQILMPLFVGLGGLQGSELAFSHERLPFQRFLSGETTPVQFRGMKAYWLCFLLLSDTPPSANTRWLFSLPLRPLWSSTCLFCKHQEANNSLRISLVWNSITQ